ncbi:MAG: hypothetical protein ABI528_00410 [bacterium]
MIRSLHSKVSNIKHPFVFGAILITFVFLITRLPFLINYPVLVLSSDSASYCAAAFDIMNLQMPLFDIRTPGYPLFLSFVWMISKTAYAVSLMQSLFTLAASIFLLFAFSRSYASLTILFAVSICGFISSTYYLLLESSILTEGLFTGMMMICSGFLVMALKENKNYQWILFSLTSAVLILIRPAGLFLLAVMLCLVLFFLVNKYNFRYYASLILPFSVILIGLCTYNLFTLNKFTITPFGEANLMGATLLYMESSEEYPEFVNAAIKNTLDSIPRMDLNLVRNSSDISKLYHTFNENFYRQINLTANLMQLNPGLTFVDIQPIIRQISLDAIKKNPKVYIKFFVSNFLFFLNNIKIELSYFEQLAGVYKRSVVEKKYTKEMESGRWRQISSDKSDYETVKNFFNDEIARQNDLSNVSYNEKGDVELKPTILKNVFEIYECIYNLVFRNLLWLVLFGSVLALSIFKLWKSKFKNIDAFIPLLFCIIFLSKAMLVSSVEVSLARYSYTVEFAIYFSLPFLFILLKNSNKKSPDKIT